MPDPFVHDLGSHLTPESDDSKPVETPVEQPVVTDSDPATPPATPVATPPAEDQGSEPIDMGLFKINVPKAEETPQELTPESFFETVSKKYGFEVKSFDEALGKFKEFKETKTKLGEVESEATQYKNLVAAMPMDLQAIFADHLNGKDYHQTMKNLVGSNIDITKDVSHYPKEKLVMLYNSDITQEEYEEMDERTISRLYSAAVKSYEYDKKQYADQAKAFETQQKDAARLVMQSTDNSIAKLREVFPDMKKTQIDNIANKMKTNYLSSLIDEKGTWREDAAVKIALSEYGMDVINQMKEQLVKEMQKQVKLAKSDAVAEIVKEKFNDNPPKETHSAADPSLQDSVRKALSFM